MPRDLANAATIVSLFPLPIFERKPLLPSVYQIPAAAEDRPEILVVREGVFYVYLDEFRGSMTIRTPAITVAESIVRDFLDGQHLMTEDARPAIWVVPGEWLVSEVYNDPDQKAKIQNESALQLEWFKRICTIADDEWSKFHQHRMITDVQRVAAKRLRYVREWAQEVKPQDIADCPGCGAVINKKVAVCRECNCIINEELYAQLKFVGTHQPAPAR